jgi:hypothetical protein
MRLAPVVVSLPLFLCAAQFVNPMARAAGMEATEVTVLLAKSQTIDTKCKVLSADKSQELKDFVARAEISLAEKASVAIARKSITDGRAQGRAAVCDASASRLVNDVLAAANRATTESVEDVTAAEAKTEPKQVEDAVALVEPQQPVAKAKPVQSPKQQASLIKPPKAKATVKAEVVTKPVKVKQSLGTYAAVAEKYFIARRCRNVSGPEIGKMYKTVLANHKQAMASNKPAEVRAMLRAVEGRADGKSCG